MNIKSLLLGSAAALVAVSGARAADAVVVAEPEPQEYVRICDVYGAGFFYIPGTETCLKIGGYARYDIAGGNLDRYYSADTDGDNKNDTYYKRARVQLRVDARSETELGTLRAYGSFNVQSTRNSSSSLQQGLGVDQAFLELGGFMAGKRDSTFVTFNDYAGAVISDDLGVPYGPYDTNQVSYTYTGGNGFSAVVALETGNDSYGTDEFSYVVNPVTNEVTILGTGLGGGHLIDDYMPNVVVGVKYAQSWGVVSLVGGYDSFMEEGAVKGRLDVYATEQLSLFIEAGWSSNSPEYAYVAQQGTPGTPAVIGFRGGLGNVNANNYYAQWNGDWGVWGGGTYKINDKTKVNLQVAYDQAENFAAVLDVAYDLVPGLTITPEIAYVDNFSGDYNDDEGLGKIGGVGGFIRFQRSF